MSNFLLMAFHHYAKRANALNECTRFLGMLRFSKIGLVRSELLIMEAKSGIISMWTKYSLVGACVGLAMITTSGNALGVVEKCRRKETLVKIIIQAERRAQKQVRHTFLDGRVRRCRSMTLRKSTLCVWIAPRFEIYSSAL
mmetsp:Transcript_28603/g.60134  ORF Transcript_28603/g.60134 Transcript_28603/m.60134 type:complete len:141 (-) Transcript_28603:1305-1727(-)